MSYIASLDQGTSSTRCMIFDPNGRVISIAQKEHHQFTPQAGWVEHDAREIWQNTQEVIQTAIKTAGIATSEISAIGVTNQRETIVAWDSQTGAPLHRAIVWQDTRTANFLNELDPAVKQVLIQKTGLAIAPYFSASKIHWLLNNVAEVRDALALGRLRVGTIDSWLMWNITNALHITDVTNASRTMLMNLKTLDWDQELLDIWGTTNDITKLEIPQETVKIVYEYVTETLPKEGTEEYNNIVNQESEETQKTILEKVKKQKESALQPGIEPGTTRTLSEYYTIKPQGRHRQ